MKIKTITLLSVLVALSCGFSVMDRLISNFIIASIPFIAVITPTFKIGLANIVILFCLYRLPLKQAIVVTLLKSVLISFVYGSLVTFIIGFSGTAFSFIIMSFLKNILRKEKYVIFISSVGGFTHTLGQITASAIFYGLFSTNKDLLLYLPFFLVLGIITGFIMGLIAEQLLKRFKKIEKEA